MENHVKTSLRKKGTVLRSFVICAAISSGV